jgi:pantoate--beta-alanine ligase
MKIFKNKVDLQSWIDAQKDHRLSIGFVPTMGALHEGHMSLIAQAKSNSDVVVCSIFVNPTQFNDVSDFEKYPITIDEDIALLTESGCDVLFLPNVVEMYPNGIKNLEYYDLGYVETVLDGAARPGHFQGVAQVVSRLLDAVGPHTLYLGQKDYQQCLVLKRLLEIKNSDIVLSIVPTKREQDGLALSSRNRRLTAPQRALATLLYQCLISIEAQQGIKSFEVVQKECIDLLAHKGFKPDYVALADAATLELLEDYSSQRPMVALIAAIIGDVRLIDNLPLKK